MATRSTGPYFRPNAVEGRYRVLAEGGEDDKILSLFFDGVGRGEIVNLSLRWLGHSLVRMLLRVCSLTR